MAVARLYPSLSEYALAGATIGKGLAGLVTALAPYFSEEARKRRKEQKMLEELKRHAQIAEIMGKSYEGIEPEAIRKAREQMQIYTGVLGIPKEQVPYYMKPSYGQYELAKEKAPYEIESLKSETEARRENVKLKKQQFDFDKWYNTQRINIAKEQLKIMKDKNIRQEVKDVFGAVNDTLNNQLKYLENEMKVACRLDLDPTLTMGVNVDPNTGEIVEEGGIPFSEWQNRCIRQYQNQIKNILDRQVKLTQSFAKSAGKEVFLPKIQPKENLPELYTGPEDVRAKTSGVVSTSRFSGYSIPDVFNYLWQKTRMTEGPYAGVFKMPEEKMRMIREQDKIRRQNLLRTLGDVLHKAITYPPDLLRALLGG
ncbi:MAG: hypothetical protein DRG20_00945 [Deltaproteobacteria bacterium]|nr:MAG: hypothetical protein DRG20_00945 [Deltaproteobacteria bacterium]